MSAPVVHIKYAPEAWRVHEQLALDSADGFAGHGEHAYFYVEKRNLNSAQVARQLAESCGVGVDQVGYAGMKDRHAITRQWFSVPYAGEDWPLQNASPQADNDASVRCLKIARHTHKLRRGQHSANSFILRLRLQEAAHAEEVAALDDWFPNFFGPQRLSSANLFMAHEWLQGDSRQPSRRRGRGRTRGRSGGRRGWHLSVLRSELFNAVLAQRVEAGNYSCVIPGDVLDEGVPTGPLWGRGRSPATDEAALIEQTALQPHRATCDALEYTGLQQARRRLAQRPGHFICKMLGAEGTAAELEVSFDLPPGAYATALLAHKLTVHDDSKKYE